MASVFISYRQIDDEHRDMVRGFAIKLQRTGIKIVLDQFLEAEEPGVPNELAQTE